MARLPNSWLSEEISNKIDFEGNRTQALKKKIANSISQDYDEGLLIDINEPTITEYLSFLICESRNEGLIDNSPILQGFISYRISAHDFIADEHYCKNGNETLLKTHGKEYLIGLMNLYGKVSHSLASTIQELGIVDATTMANNQYNQIIEGDNKRNRSFIARPEEAIEIQESLAGKPARYLAQLSGGNYKDQKSVAHLVNAMCTLEDLMHFMMKIDIREPKSTIPISFLYQKYGPNSLIQSEIQKTKAWQESVDFTLNYIKKELSRFRHLQKEDGIVGIEEFATSIDFFIQQHIESIR